MRVVVLIMLGLLTTVANGDPSAGIILSYETTRISELLNDDGTVNYLAALNEEYSKGVTLENNAAVLLIRASGPDKISKAYTKPILTALGMSNLPKKGDYFVSLYEYTNGSEETDEIFRVAREEPWSVKEYPQLAAWLKANQKPLGLVIKATSRQRYYMPLISEDDPPVIVAVFPSTLNSREMGRALVARAMLKLDSGNVDGVCSDLLAVHRLARLVGQSPTLIERLVGMALELEACEGDNALAVSGHLTAEQAKACLSQLRSLPVLPDISEALDKSERYVLLDTTVNVYRMGYKKWLMGLFDIPAELLPLMRDEFLAKIDLSKMDKAKALQAHEMPVDWNDILRRLNSWQDGVMDAIREPTFAERMKALEQINSQQQELKEGTDFIELLVAEEYTNTTETLGSIIIAILASDFSRAVAFYDRAILNLEVSIVAVALAGYRAEEGSYPENLAELCPKYFKTVPEDMFTAKPLDYQRNKNGYRLCSPGPDTEEDYDDIVVETTDAEND